MPRPVDGQHAAGTTPCHDEFDTALQHVRVVHRREVARLQSCSSALQSDAPPSEQRNQADPECSEGRPLHDEAPKKRVTIPSCPSTAASFYESEPTSYSAERKLLKELSSEYAMGGQVEAQASSASQACSEDPPAMGVTKSMETYAAVSHQCGPVGPIDLQKIHLREVWKDTSEEVLNDCRQKYSFNFVDGWAFALTAPVFEMPTPGLARRLLKSKWILHPIGPPRLIWNFLSLFWIAFDIVTIPLAAFDVGDQGAFKVIEWITTIFWTIDIIMVFRTGYFIRSSVEMRPLKIALKYARTWLLLDLAIVTLEWITHWYKQRLSASSLRFTRVLRSLRLVRFVKMLRLWAVIAEQIHSSLFDLSSTIIQVVLCLSVIVHILACCWYAIGKSSDGWVSYYAYTGDTSFRFWYVTCLRWVIGQLNGDTDVEEQRTVPERWFICFLGIVLAVTAQAVVIGVITNTMNALSDLVSEKTRRLRHVNDYLTNHPIKPEIAVCVKRYAYAYRDTGNVKRTEEEILSILPRHLQTELLFEVHGPVLTQHALFRSLHREARAAFRHICRRIATTIVVVKDEVIFETGEACPAMKFLHTVSTFYSCAEISAFAQNELRHSRSLSMILPATTASKRIMKDVIHMLERNLFGNLWHNMKDSMGLGSERDRPGIALARGAWICEIALWSKWTNRGKLVALASGHIYGIDSHDLARGMQSYPDAYALASLYAVEFLSHFKQQEFMSDLTDLGIEIENVV